MPRSDLFSSNIAAQTRNASVQFCWWIRFDKSCVHPLFDAQQKDANEIEAELLRG
jgi:hypothetical protein